MKRFALIGAAGYIAPRHMKAIKDTSNELLCAYDKSDSVGVIDSYFPNADFFVEQELFDRHCSKLKRIGTPIDYFSICSPNYLHDSHIRYGLRMGSDVICEKPLVLNPWNLDALQIAQQESGHKINAIFQLRLHPSIVALKEQVERQKEKIFDIDLTYITSRGNWYYTSWKGDVQKSGGVATNIGIHFYDMLMWVFGGVKKSVVHISTHDRVAGFLELERANVRYFLSINQDCLPNQDKRTYRVIKIDGEEFEFSEGFTELHTLSYQKIIEGAGFGLDDARPSIELVYGIRNAQPVGLVGEYHPLASLPLTDHPFVR